MMPSANLNDVEFKGLLNRAIKLKRAGKPRAAIKILKSLAEIHPRSAAVAGYLGGAFYELGDYEQSTELFRKASTLSPRSETSSLGLFHSLWKLDQLSEAFGEMRRFLSGSDSKQYAALLRDLVVERRLEPRSQLVGAAK